MKEPKEQAQACVIWLHGLGADASDMMGLAEQLALDELAFRHVFIDAPLRPVTINNGMTMSAWYDIKGMKLTDRQDSEGILASDKLIEDAFAAQLKEGFSEKQIFLAGFSQGGAMALYFSLHKKEVAGVIALSAYMPLANESKPILAKETPFFIAGGLYDPIVLPLWNKQSIQYLEQAGYSKLTCVEYPMEHSVCMDEIKALSLWLKTQVKGIK